MASVKTMKGKTQPQPSLMSYDHSLGNQAQSLKSLLSLAMLSKL